MGSLERVGCVLQRNWWVRDRALQNQNQIKQKLFLPGLDQNKRVRAEKSLAPTQTLKGIRSQIHTRHNDEFEIQSIVSHQLLQKLMVSSRV